MIRYFKDSWEKMYEINKKSDNLVEIEDVYEDYSEAAQFLVANEVDGRIKGGLNEI